MLEHAADALGGGAEAAEPVDLAPLHAKIGQLTLENDFLEGALTKAVIAECKAMIDRDHQVPVTRQAQLLSMSRGAVYYLPRPLPARPSWR